jgi:hypothetical protein
MDKGQNHNYKTEKTISLVPEALPLSDAAAKAYVVKLYKGWFKSSDKVAFYTSILKSLQLFAPLSPKLWGRAQMCPRKARFRSPPRGPSVCSRRDLR